MITGAVRGARRLVGASTYLRREVGLLKRTPVGTRREMLDRMSDIFGGLLHELGVRLEVRGQLPPPGSIMVCNHLSYLDPMLICAAIPSCPIGKAEVATWPVISDGAKRCGVIFVDRENLGSRTVALRKAMRVLADGSSIVNFPEGTTTEGNHVLEFKRGIFGAAQIMNRPVYPLALQFSDKELTWTGGDLFLPHVIKTAIRRCSTAWITIGEPLVPSQYASADVLARASRASVLDLLRENSNDVATAIAA